MTWLTETEMKAQRREVAEKRCGVCIWRKRIGSVGNIIVWDCRKGMEWPKYGLCLGMELDEGQDHDRD